MPRLPPSLYRQARAISCHAPGLLSVCRDLQSTANELSWIREHIEATPSIVPPKLRLWQLCQRRGKGVPLQYVLGTQPFGDLDILCRSGVLIPRPETESYTTALADILLAHHKTLGTQKPEQEQETGPRPPALRILDLCTGTGCIALHLYARLAATYPALHVHVHVLGVDVSPRAVSLARQNLRHALRNGSILSPPLPPRHQHQPQEQKQKQTIRFAQADIFAPDWWAQVSSADDGFACNGGGNVDVLVCNPPYISRRGFAQDTARSVRNFEPRLALVPDVSDVDVDVDEGRGQGQGQWKPEDVFYARLLRIADDLGAATLLFEVADLAQAERVVRGLFSFSSSSSSSLGQGKRKSAWKVEIWRDWPGEGVGSSSSSTGIGGETVEIEGRTVPVRGDGEGRCVFATRVPSRD